MSLVDDLNLIADFLTEDEEAFIEALTMYSLIALVDEIIFEAFPNIQEEQFIELSATIVYDDELNNITNELLTDYFADNFDDKNEAKLKLHGFRNFNMNVIVPLIHDYVKDFTENEIVEDSIAINGGRFYDESLLEVTLLLKETNVWIRTTAGEEVEVETILDSKQIFIDIKTVIETSEDPIFEGNALYMTALVLVAGTEVINYYKKDEDFVMRLVELFKQNGLTIKLNEIK